MRIEQLYYLVEVAKYKSISFAAEHIYVTQPTISEAIRKLEKELGAELLQRTHQGVFLTEAGKKVVPRAKEIIRIIDEIELDLKAGLDDLTLSGELNIYVSPAVCSSLLPSVLMPFHKKHPKVKKTIIEREPLDIILDVASGKGDLGLIAMADEYFKSEKISSIFASNEICFHKLLHDNLVTCVKKHSPLAARESISISEILKLPLVFYKSGYETDHWITELLKKYGEPNILFQTSSFDVYKKTIANGLAIGLLWGFCFHEGFIIDEDIIPIPITNSIKVTIGCLRLNNIHPSVEVKEFIKTLEFVLRSPSRNK